MLSITPVGGMPAHRHLATNMLHLRASVERLSSGLRLNRAADDAAGLTISEGMRARAIGLQRAAANLQDGINLLGTAEGGLAAIQDLVQRLRELAVRAGDDALGVKGRDALQLEANALRAEINRLVVDTEFNGYKVLLGEWDPTGGINTTTQAYSRGSTTSFTVTAPSITASPLTTTYSRSLYGPAAPSQDFTSNEYLLGFSADDMRIGARRGATVDEVYAATGSVAANAAETFTIRPSVTIGGATYTLTDHWTDAGGNHYDGIYVSKNGGPLKLVQPMLNSAGVGMSFNSTGTQIAYAAIKSPSIGQDVFTRSFNPATMAVGGQVLINQDGDMLDVPTSYKLSNQAEWFVRADGVPSLMVEVMNHDGTMRTVAYDPTGTNGYTIRADHQTIDLWGSGRIDSNDVLQVSYQADYNMATNDDGNVSLKLGVTPEVYALGTAAGSITVQRTHNGAVSTLAYDPTHTNGWDYVAGTNTVTIYGNARPVGDDTVDVFYRTDHYDYGTFSGAVSADQDGVVEMAIDPLYKPEVYNLGTPASASIEVKLGATVLAYDPTHTNGWDYNAGTNTIALYGSARPNTSQTVTLTYVRDYVAPTNQDGEMQLRLTSLPDLYHLSDGGASRAMRVYLGATELVYDPVNGFTYNAATQTLTLHGTARPPAGGSVRVAVVSDGTPDNAYTTALPSGAATYAGAVSVTKTVGGVSTPLTRLAATDGTGDGFFLSGTTLGLAGTGAPDAANPTTTYTIGYATDAGNAFILNPSFTATPPAGVAPQDYFAPLTKLGVDLASIAVTVDGVAVAADPANGFSAAGTPGDLVGAIQTYNGVGVTLNGASRLTAGTHAVAISYDFVQVDTRSPYQFTFQVGANEGEAVTLGITPVDVAGLGLGAFSLHTQAQAQSAIAAADAAIGQLSVQRSTLGAAINGLDATWRVATAGAQEALSGLSRLRDTDVAEAFTAQLRARILSQAALAAQAQFHVRDRSLLRIVV